MEKPSWFYDGITTKEIFHEWIYDMVKGYKCAYCDIIFKSSVERSQHAKKEHPDSPKLKQKRTSYPCVNGCGFIGKSYFIKRNHEKACSKGIIIKSKNFSKSLDCECGGRYTHASYNKHIKTMKHQNYEKENK